jgi:hypothetical protein
MVALTEQKRDVQTRLDHLARNPLYQKEKPYGAVDFVGAGNASNHSFETAEVVMHDARPIKSSFSLENEGFCFLDHATSATFEGLKQGGRAIELYHHEIEGLVRQHFPEYKRVDVIDHWVGSHC